MPCWREEESEFYLTSNYIILDPVTPQYIVIIWTAWKAQHDKYDSKNPARRDPLRLRPSIFCLTQIIQVDVAPDSQKRAWTRPIAW